MRPKVDPVRGRVYEHGRQSWNPSATYPVTATGHRPARAVMRTMCWRPGRPGPERGFQGEGLLAVDPGDAGHNRDQDLRGLDPVRAEPWLREVFGRLRSYGFDHFKLDFLYAGALGDLEAYRHGLAVIRDAAGRDAYLLGCGAPIPPSVGLVDAMRVSPDIDPACEPAGGDMSRSSQRAATLTTIGRAWQHGRFWVNDPDCLIARPAVERREEWARTVERYGGLRGSSDRIADLDDWGLATTRRLLSSVPDPAVPFALSADRPSGSGAGTDVRPL